jgi:hypothetical protein
MGFRRDDGKKLCGRDYPISFSVIGDSWMRLPAVLNTALMDC